MNSYVLTCCSTADLSKEHMEARNLKYVFFHYVMDGKQYPDDLGQSMPFKEFYTRMANGAEPTLSLIHIYSHNQ